MSSESFPATQITEERTVVSSLDDSAPVKDAVSTTTTTTLPTTATTTVPSTTSTTSHLNDTSVPSTTSHLTDTDTSVHSITSTTSHLADTNEETISATGTAQQVAANLASAATTVAASAFEGAKNLAGVVYENAPSKEQVGNAASMTGQGAANVGAAVGQGAVNVGSKAAEMAPSGEQVKDAGVAVGSGAYTAGSAVGSGAYNASAAVGNTAANAGSAAANTVSNTASAVGSTAANAANYIKDTVKEYLPTAVVGSSPSTTLASIETDEKRYSQTSLPSVTDSPVPSSHPKSSHALPSQEHAHTSTHTGVGSLAPGDSVSVFPGAKTHDLASTGGVADIAGESVAQLPDEREVSREGVSTRGDVGSNSGVRGNETGGATAVGAGALPGYMGESNVAPVPLESPKSGADSTASTRTLAGSIAPSTTTSGSGSGFESSTHPSTGTNPSTTGTQSSFTKGPSTATNPSTTTAHPSTTSAAATYLSTATNPPTTSDTPKKGTMEEAKDLFLSMETHARDQPASKLPGTQTHKQDSLGRQQSVDTPLSTRATIGHGTPISPMSTAGERLATASAGAGAGHVGAGTGTGVGSTGTGVGSTANTGPYPRTSTTGGPVSNQHPDMPTAPSGPHTGRHAGATESRYTSSNAGVSGAGVGHTDTGKEKVTLKDKIKGEAKVISGKIGGNEEKVEVGKRMMGKN